jgi:hypothetical protein
VGLFKKRDDTPHPARRKVTCLVCDGTGKRQEVLFTDPGGMRPSVPDGATWVKTFNCLECHGRGKVDN